MSASKSLRIDVRLDGALSFSNWLSSKSHGQVYSSLGSLIPDLRDPRIVIVDGHREGKSGSYDCYTGNGAATGCYLGWAGCKYGTLSYNCKDNWAYGKTIGKCTRQAAHCSGTYVSDTVGSFDIPRKTIYSDSIGTVLGSLCTVSLPFS